MSTVIKAGEQASASARPIAFNFDDVVGKANAVLQETRKQAEAILAQARQEAEKIKQAAEERGRREAQGKVESVARNAAEQKVAKQLETLRPALSAAIGAMHTTREEWLVHWQQNLVKLATAIAERIVRRELAREPEITLDLVREALQLASGAQRVRVRLSPADHAALGHQAAELAAQWHGVGGVDIVADTSVSPGGCVVSTEYGVIDQQLAAQLARIEEELS